MNIHNILILQRFAGLQTANAKVQSGLECVSFAWALHSAYANPFRGFAKRKAQSRIHGLGVYAIPPPLGSFQTLPPSYHDTRSASVGVTNERTI